MYSSLTDLHRKCCMISHGTRALPLVTTVVALAACRVGFSYCTPSGPSGAGLGGAACGSWNDTRTLNHNVQFVTNWCATGGGCAVPAFVRVLSAVRLALQVCRVPRIHQGPTLHCRRVLCWRIHNNARSSAVGFQDRHQPSWACAGRCLHGHRCGVWRWSWRPMDEPFVSCWSWLHVRCNVRIYTYRVSAATAKVWAHEFRDTCVQRRHRARLSGVPWKLVLRIQVSRSLLHHMFVEQYL